MKLMEECTRFPPENIYYKPVIQELCYESYLYPKKNPCKYGKWNYCNFTLREPYSIKAFDLNRFTAICQNTTKYKNTKIVLGNQSYPLERKRRLTSKPEESFSEETCFCLTYGPYIGYFDEHCPLLDCVCYPQNINYTQVNVTTQANTQKEKCVGSIRRKCTIRYYDDHTMGGACRQMKQPFTYEETIVCLNNSLLEQISNGHLIIPLNKIQQDLPSSYPIDSSIFLEKTKSPSFKALSFYKENRKCCNLQLEVVDILFFTFLTFICYMLFYMSYNIVLRGSGIFRKEASSMQIERCEERKSEEEKLEKQIKKKDPTNHDDDNDNENSSKCSEYVCIF